MNRRWEILRCVTEVIYTFLFTGTALKWSSHVAYIQRWYGALDYAKFKQAYIYSQENCLLAEWVSCKVDGRMRKKSCLLCSAMELYKEVSNMKREPSICYSSPTRIHIVTDSGA